MEPKDLFDLFDLFGLLVHL